MKLMFFFNSRLVKNTFLYSFINILDKAIPFLIMPIISRVLTKEGMGYYTLYQVTLAVLLPILTCSTDFALNISYFKLGKEEFAKYQSSGIYVTLLIFLILLIVSLPFSEMLSKAFGIDTIYLYCTYVIVILQYFTQLRLNLWQAQENPILYGLFALPLSLMKYGLSLILILYFNTGWVGIVYGNLMGLLLFALIAVISYWREHYLLLVIKLDYVKQILKVSIPISIHSISGWLSTSINRIFINSMLGVAATGSFGIGSTFGTIVTVLDDAANKAYWPYLFGKLKNFDDNSSRQIVRLIYFYYVLFILSGLFVGLIGYIFVDIIFGDLYMDTRVFIMPLVVSSIINGIYKLHVNIIFYTQKTYIIARNTLVCAIVNIISSYFFIKHLGLIGAAYSAVITQFVLYILTVYYSNKLYKLPWFSCRISRK